MEQLTDVGVMNARIIHNHPGSKACFAAVQVMIIAVPPALQSETLAALELLAFTLAEEKDDAYEDEWT
ncbi:MAG: hypothetical protein M3017_11305, partial [Actinomycetota bacterium]|nr:hypothetical protein [Actinomycetota bacterium]